MTATPTAGRSANASQDVAGAPADGAFYLYADVSHRCADSEAFCRRLLAETGIALTPGIDFDPGRGRRFVRISFAGATETITEAVARLETWA